MKKVTRLLGLLAIALLIGCTHQHHGEGGMQKIDETVTMEKPAPAPQPAAQPAAAPSAPPKAMGGKPVSITKPAQASTVLAPVEICMSTSGYTVEPAKNGVNPGKGHHHLLIDVPVPADLSKPIGKDANHVHMGDGSSCKTLDLSPGIHTIRALFAKGNHVPYDPPVTAAIVVLVR